MRNAPRLVVHPDALSERERQVIRECLCAAAYGPFFDDDDEFQTITGVTKADVAEVAAAWPDPELDERTQSAVHGSLGNLLGFPHGRERHWSEWISASTGEVASVFAAWLRATRGS